MFLSVSGQVVAFLACDISHYYVFVHMKLPSLAENEKGERPERVGWGLAIVQ
jgi:hypothetical protein